MTNIGLCLCWLLTCWFSSLGNCTSWSQMSNSHHRRRDGKRPSEVTGLFDTLLADFLMFPANHIFLSLLNVWYFYSSHINGLKTSTVSLPLSSNISLFLSLCLSFSLRCSGPISSQQWSFTTPTSSILRIITCFQTPGGRNGKREFRFPWAPSPSPNLQYGTAGRIETSSSLCIIQ